MKSIREWKKAWPAVRNGTERKQKIERNNVHEVNSGGSLNLFSEIFHRSVAGKYGFDGTGVA